MNICLCSREYPPETGWGGIGTYVYNLAHGLTKLGHKVVVISQSVDSQERDYFDLGVHVFRIRRRRIPFITHSYLGDLIHRLEYSFSVFCALTRIEKTVPIDIIEVPEWYNEGLFLFLKRRIPYVTKLHGPYYLVSRKNLVLRGLGSQLIERLEEFCVQYAQGISAPSRNLAENVSRDYRITSEKIKVIPYPLDFDLFRPTSNVSNTDTPKILYVGRLEMRKGVHIFIDAMENVIREFPEVQAVFIGSDTATAPDGSSFKEYLMSKIKAAGSINNFHFMGYLQRNEIIKYYTNCTLGVVPSLYDNLPYVCLEAMACGLPLVASDTGGISEIIDNGINGMLVPSGDPDILADTIIELINNEKLRSSISKEATIKIRKHFNAEEIATQAYNYYQQVLHGNGLSRFS